MAEVSFRGYEVTLRVDGPLHATSPQDSVSIGYMLARQPTEAVLAARVEAGETMVSMPELRAQVEEEVGATPEASHCAVFRRDEEGRPFLHPNFLKGHLRDAGEALSRMLKIWGLQGLINKGLFIRPERVYLIENGLPMVVLVEEWPTHFEIYRMGRVSAFRKAEFVNDPVIKFRVYALADPRWTADLVTQLFEYGSIKGIGGGRGRGMGQYRFEVKPLREGGGFSSAEFWADKV